MEKETSSKDTTEGGSLRQQVRPCRSVSGSVVFLDPDRLADGSRVFYTLVVTVVVVDDFKASLLAFLALSLRFSIL